MSMRKPYKNQRPVRRICKTLSSLIHQIQRDQRRLARKRREYESQEKQWKIISQITILNTLPPFKNIAKFYDSNLFKKRHIFDLYFEMIDGYTLRILTFLVQTHMITEKTILFWLKQALKGLDHLHKNHIIHRNLSINHILISSDGILKIINFGQAVLQQNPKSQTKKCGQIYYRSPQMIVPDKEIGKQTDIWSLAMVFYQFTHKTLPFSKVVGQNKLYNDYIDYNEKDYIKVIEEQIIDKQFQYPSSINACKINNILKIMLKKQASQRPKISQLLQHEDLQFDLDYSWEQYAAMMIKVARESLDRMDLQEQSFYQYVHKCHRKYKNKLT